MKYIKPNMAALEGEIGQEIYNTILNVPDTNWEELHRKSKEIEKRILKAQLNKGGSMITLIGTGCPKCYVLSQKLRAKKIDFKTSNNIDEAIDNGFMSAPVLKVGNEYMDFGTAVKWVNNQ